VNENPDSGRFDPYPQLLGRGIGRGGETSMKRTFLDRGKGPPERREKLRSLSLRFTHEKERVVGAEGHWVGENALSHFKEEDYLGPVKERSSML